LNVGIQLEKMGVLERLGVKVLGTPIRTLEVSEDRDLFVQALNGESTPTQVRQALTCRNRYPRSSVYCCLDDSGRSGCSQSYRIPYHFAIRFLAWWSRIRFRSQRGGVEEFVCQEFESKSPGLDRKESERMEGSRVRGGQGCCRCKSSSSRNLSLADKARMLSSVATWRISILWAHTLEIPSLSPHLRRFRMMNITCFVPRPSRLYDMSEWLESVMCSTLSTHIPRIIVSLK
jgi:hypothetical protein